MTSSNPYLIVDEFEKRIAEWCGSKYAVTTDSCSSAIFLCLNYRRNVENKKFSHIAIPKHTYPSTPCSIIHVGYKVLFEDRNWSGEYELIPIKIYDAALRLKKGMYHGGMQCISFHIKKHLPIGRGGMILLDDEEAYKWLKLARFDGREPIPLLEQKEFNVLGWNVYMQPSDAARGVQLFEVYRQKYPEGADDLKVEEQGYPDLSLHKIYTQ